MRIKIKDAQIVKTNKNTKEMPYLIAINILSTASGFEKEKTLHKLIAQSWTTEQTLKIIVLWGDKFWVQSHKLVRLCASSLEKQKQQNIYILTLL